MGSQEIEEIKMDKMFSQENRARLVYLVGDLLEKPRPHSLGGYEGGQEFFQLDELLRRHLGKMRLTSSGVFGFDAIVEFIQVGPAKQLLDLIEAIPVAKSTTDRSQRFPFRPLTMTDLQNMHIVLNQFLEKIGSRARFEKDGSFNRDGFEILEKGVLAGLPKKEELTADLRTLGRGSELVGVILVDLDNFKAVNDRHGHDRGDECLGAVVGCIGEAILRKGKLYRFREGDEFVALLRNATTAEASATAERIRKNIEQQNPGGDIRVTSSIGVVSTESLGIDTAEKLLEVVDEAMYVSKFTGRNRVTVCPVPSDTLNAAREERKRERARSA
jgi:diguanylate cyclase (GGDEF)-like protein